MSDELVDVVDAADQVIATVPRSRMRAENLRHRAVFVVVRSSVGDVLIHRRSASKDVWPGWWDFAVGGVLTAGEGYDEAAAREVAEELGIAADGLVHLGAGTYEDGVVRLHGRVYELACDGPFTFADGEVVEAAFVGRTELDQRLERDDFLPDSRALVLAFLRSGGASPGGVSPPLA
jgi:isopentenyldiphosphate isomerase